jgi:hypothetical protein
VGREKAARTKKVAGTFSLSTPANAAQAPSPVRFAATPASLKRPPGEKSKNRSVSGFGSGTATYQWAKALERRRLTSLRSLAPVPQPGSGGEKPPVMKTAAGFPV